MVNVVPFAASVTPLSFPDWKNHLSDPGGVAKFAMSVESSTGAVALLDRTVEYPGFLQGTLDLGHQILVQPLQVCLLAVAYDRVVSRARALSVARPGS